MCEDEFKSWVTFDFCRPEEIFPTDAWLVKKCVEIVQNADIRNWSDAEAYGQHSPHFCATLVVRSALGVSAALTCLKSLEAKDFDVRARYADRLRAASTTFGQAKERMLAFSEVMEPDKQALVTLKRGDAGSSKRLAKEPCAAEGPSTVQQDFADTLVERVQKDANRIWKQNLTLSKRAMADYLVRMGKGQGLSAGTIRQRIKRPKES